MLEQAVKPEIKLRQFEGPLDLLLHLIEKNDVDIYDIPISTITAQYMQYIESMKEFDMERFYRDQRILQIGEGTSEILRLVISRAIGC